MGAGSARPVVSRMMASNFLRVAESCPRVRIRSPRTEQHTQPLSIVIRSSGASIDSATDDLIHDTERKMLVHIRW